MNQWENWDQLNSDQYYWQWHYWQGPQPQEFHEYQYQNYQQHHHHHHHHHHQQHQQHRPFPRQFHHHHQLQPPQRPSPPQAQPHLIAYPENQGHTVQTNQSVDIHQHHHPLNHIQYQQLPDHQLEQILETSLTPSLPTDDAHMDGTAQVMGKSTSKKLPEWLKDSIRSTFVQDDPKKRKAFTEDIDGQSTTNEVGGNSEAAQPEELKLDADEIEQLNQAVKLVVTHVLLDVTSIICKDLARDVFKDKKGVDPLEPVKEESQSEKSDSDAEAPPLLKEHEVIVPDKLVRKLPVKLDLALETPADGLYELHVFSSNVFKATIVCNKAVLLLGRDPSTDFTDPHGSVSRLHSALLFTQRSAYLVDLDSTSGTLLNGKSRLTPRVPVPLKYGDYFTQGQQSYKQYKLAAPKKLLKGQVIPVVPLEPPRRTKLVKRKVLRKVIRKERRKKAKARTSIWDEDSDEDQSHEEVEVEVEEEVEEEVEVDDLPEEPEAAALEAPSPPATQPPPPPTPREASGEVATEAQEGTEEKKGRRREKGEKAKDGKKEKAKKEKSRERDKSSRKEKKRKARSREHPDDEGRASPASMPDPMGESAHGAPPASGPPPPGSPRGATAHRPPQEPEREPAAVQGESEERRRPRERERGRGREASRERRDGRRDSSRHAQDREPEGDRGRDRPRDRGRSPERPARDRKRGRSGSRERARGRSGSRDRDGRGGHRGSRASPRR